MPNIHTEESEAIQDRECGACSLCCKLVAVDELNKVEGVWCTHCAPGKGGCLIYDSRPSSCRGFHCGWLQTADFGPEWRPTKSRMVIAAEGDGNRISIYVDPSFPTNWRKEPYYSQLRDLAIEMAQGQKQLLIRINSRAIAMLPDQEIDLGRCERDDQILVSRDNRTGEWGARLVPAKDVPLEQRGKWISSGW
ncbi:YkgJ family cysteine cluster protein [Bradyrhizobium sp.]|jgi:hypothetical protein|uniref:YkgJ family cysteine cluster protein n=1 Tax=Bradyrhizobium sp. TaxID=376 RepID=UPI003C32024D